MVKRILWLALMLPAFGLNAAQESSVETGGLTCYKVDGGYNLLITSKALLRCVYKNSDALEAWYKGETGVGLGVDLKFESEQTLNFGVLSSTTAFVSEGDFLSGSYAGAGAEVALGVGIGAHILIGGSDKTIGLKPAIETSEGAGVAAGLTYLNLESDPLNNARIATPRGETFAQALYSAYFDQAYNDYYAPDYAASDHFSGRAIAATGKEQLLPADATGDELIAARERLVTALHNGGREYFGVQSAHAQANFDCWSYRASNGADAGAVAECKKRFLHWQVPLEAEIRKMDIAKMRQRMIMESRISSIYFDTDSTELNEDAKSIVNNLLALVPLYKEAVIYIEGHTDRAGSKAHNLKLSDARAESVKRALVRSGIPLPWISDLGYGKEEAQKVSTNIHDGSNRRVDIRLVPIVVNLETLKAQ